MLVLSEQFAAPDGGAVQNGVGLRDEFLPAFAVVVSGVGDEDTVAGCVFVGGDEDLSVVDGGAVEEILAGGEACGRRAGFQVHQVELGLGPTFGDGDQQQWAVVGEVLAGSVFGIAAFVEDERIAGGISTEFVIKEVAVVHVLAGCDVSLVGIAGVVEAGVVVLPGNAGGAGALDGVGQKVAGLGLDDVQRGHLRSAGRGAVGEILSGFAGLVPIEGNGAVGGELVGVNQDAGLAVNSFPHIEDGLVLHAFAAGIEIIFAGDLRWSNAADGEQFGQTLVNGFASGQGIEHGPRVGHLRFHPLLRFGGLSVLEPAIVVDDFRAVEGFLDGLYLGLRRRGGRLGVIRGVDGGC